MVKCNNIVFFRPFHVILFITILVSVTLESIMIFHKRKVIGEQEATSSPVPRFNNSAKNANIRMTAAFWINFVCLFIILTYVLVNQGAKDLNLLKGLFFDYILMLTELSIVAPIVFFVENPKIFMTVVKSFKNWWN